MFDLYLSILGAVNNHVQKALGRDAGDWRLQHACPACMYKLKEEPGLLFDILWAMDRNNSLKWMIQRSPTIHEDLSIPGPSSKQTDTQKVSEDMYISCEGVNKWAQEAIVQVAASEGASTSFTFCYVWLVSLICNCRTPTTTHVHCAGRT